MLLACLASLLPADAGAVRSPAPDPGERTRDCTTKAMLSAENRAVIRYVVWCGTQAGRVTLRLSRPHSTGFVAFSHAAAASGLGAAGPLRCRPHRGGRVFCSGHKDGPVTFRGTVAVAPGARCTKMGLNVWRWTGDSLDFPAGCPRSYQERERRIPQIIESRAYFGLDSDIEGDRAAIVRRARGLLAAWRRGDPVARWTSEEEAFGMPLRAFEQVELEYRDEYRERFQDLVEEGNWVERNAADTWAGYELDEAAGGIIYVGFTREPEASLEKLKRLLIAPDRFRPFPVTPTYTERQLEEVWFAFPDPKGPLWGLVNSTHLDYLANKIAVGTEHVAKVRKLIVRIYGPEAPFLVYFARPAILL